jgi:hypothetical protein
VFTHMSSVPLEVQPCCRLTCRLCSPCQYLCFFWQAKQANGAYHPPKAGGKGQKQGEGGGQYHSHSDKQVMLYRHPCIDHACNCCCGRHASDALLVQLVGTLPNRPA